MSEEIEIIRAVVAVIFDPARKSFLIMKKQKDWIGWQFMQGGIEQGETEEQALFREIEEETGITDAEIIRKLPYKKDYWFTRGQKKIHKFLTFFLVKSEQSNNIRLSVEHSDYKWTDAEKAIKEIKFNKAIFRNILENDLDEVSS